MEKGAVFMGRLSKSKIESIGVTYLKEIVNRHFLLEEDFRDKDKEMAYDGNIYILKENKDFSKENIFGIVPTQIKSHYDKENKKGKFKYIDKNKITYSVSIKDLLIYFKGKGVLYFQVFMTEDLSKKEIFYTALFPTKIKKYLEQKKKEDQKTININFYKLKENEIYSIARQFYSESKRQGIGEGQIVANTLSYKDVGQVDRFKFSIAQANDIFDVLEQMETGNISIYGVKKGSNLEIPIEWHDMSCCSARTRIEHDVIINGKVFYNEYEIEFGSDRNIIFILSENLQISTKDSKINFKAVGNLESIENDIKFLYEMRKSSKFIFHKRDFFEYGELLLPEEMLLLMHDTLILCKIIDNIGLEKKKKRIVIETEKKALTQLLELINKKFNVVQNENFVIENWKIEDKYYPILVFLEEGKSNKLCNIMSKDVNVNVRDAKGETYQLNTMVKIEQNVLNNLYYYDYGKMHQKIDSLEIKDLTYDSFNLVVLKLINVYDYRGDKEILYVAKHQLYKIGQFRNDIVYRINDLQIKKRLNIMTKEDIQYLKDILQNEGQNDILFAANVLLDNEVLAQKYFAMLDKETKKCFKEYPIYTLYKKLIQNTKKIG